MTDATRPHDVLGRPSDRGAALILTLFVTALLMVVGTTILTATVSNLRSTRASLDAASALDAADAGVAQGMAYLRTRGVTEVACSPSCPAAGYGNSASPARVDLGGGRGYTVWIEPISPLPTSNPGTYRIHATGTAGRGARSVVADVTIGTQPIGLPQAIFARSVEGGGTATVTRESIITTGCVYRRSKIQMTGIDAAYRIPVAVHSSQYVSDSNGSASNCGVSNKAIHRNGVACSSAYPYDHDVQGGALSSTGACSGAAALSQYYGARDLDGDGSNDVVGSRIKDEKSLRTLFGIPEQPFTAAQLDQLRETAKAQGQYYTGTSFTTPDPTAYPHSVMFFDLPTTGTGDRLVDLKNMNNTWSRQVGLPRTSSACLSRSLLIVIVNGNVRLNGNAGTKPSGLPTDPTVGNTYGMAANIVLTSPSPYGQVSKANGTASLLGTVYADAIDLTGTVDVALDDCFVQNLSPSLVDTTISVVGYRELDRAG